MSLTSRALSYTSLLWAAIVLVASLTALGVVLLSNQMTPASSCSTGAYPGYAELGPATLPNEGTVGAELVGYNRTGGMPIKVFLNQYYNSTYKKWIYPPNNGYQIDDPSASTPIIWKQTLNPGKYVDRFGDDGGTFLSPSGLSYSSRAIPPGNLTGAQAATCNYHIYKVAKPFTVDAGPIAAWFGQPGGGVQYHLNPALLQGAPTRISVSWLVAQGFLVKT